MGWALRFHGVGNSSAVELGSAMATIERDGQPWLTIDCGGEGLTAYIAQYGDYPEALFITHAHLDHVSGLERLFGANYFATPRRDRRARSFSRARSTRMRAASSLTRRPAPISANDRCAK